MVRDQESTTQKSADGEVAPTPNPETVVVGPESPHVSQKEEGGSEKTWCEHKARKRKDEVDEAAKGKATAGAENEIGRDRLEQTKRRKVVTRGRTPQHMKALKES